MKRFPVSLQYINFLLLSGSCWILQGCLMPFLKAYWRRVTKCQHQYRERLLC